MYSSVSASIGAFQPQQKTLPAPSITVLPASTSSLSYQHRFFECVFFVFLPIQLFAMLSLSSLTLSCKELDILVHAVAISLLQSKDMRLMDIHQW